MTAGKIKVTEAAALLHVSDQLVRIGMQRGILPIGTALKMSTKWTYQISEKLLPHQRRCTLPAAHRRV